MYKPLSQEARHTPALGTTHRNLLLHNRLYWVDTASERVAEKTIKHFSRRIQTDHTQQNHTQFIQIMTKKISQKILLNWIFFNRAQLGL